jgi:hypothetical protein
VIIILSLYDVGVVELDNDNYKLVLRGLDVLYLLLQSG